MKKLLLIAITCALILSATACGGDDKKKADKDTEEKVEALTDDNGVAVTDENGETVVKDEAPSANSDSKEKDDTSIEGTVIEPNTEEPSNSTGSSIQGAIVYEEDEEGNTVAIQNTLPEQITISEGGTDKGLWPDSIPDDVPEFSDYNEMYRATFEEYIDDGIKWWSLTFDASEEASDNYKKALEAAGFVKGTKDVFTYGKGNRLVEIYPEDAEDIFYVSIEVYELTLPKIPDVFYAFETNYAFYSCKDYDNTITIEYDCGSGFDQDAKAYLETLAANGFTVSGDTATIRKNGTEYSCTVDIEDTTVIYTY